MLWRSVKMAISIGSDLTQDAWRISPYARLDATQANLDLYGEASGSIYDLSFQEQGMGCHQARCPLVSAWRDTGPEPGRVSSPAVSRVNGR